MAAWRAARLLRGIPRGSSARLSDLPTSKKVEAGARPRSATSSMGESCVCAARRARPSYPSSIPRRASRSADKARHGRLQRHRPPPHTILTASAGSPSFVVTGAVTTKGGASNHGQRGKRPAATTCFVARRRIGGSYCHRIPGHGPEMIKAQGGIFGWVGSSAAIVAAAGRRSAAPTICSEPGESDRPSRPADSSPSLGYRRTEWRFRLGTNIWSTMLVLTGLLRLRAQDADGAGRSAASSRHRPDAVPEHGYYAWLAYRWPRRKPQRVCHASCISVTPVSSSCS